MNKINLSDASFEDLDQSKRLIKIKAFSYFSNKASSRILRHKTGIQYFEEWFNDKPSGFPNYIT